MKLKILFLLTLLLTVDVVAQTNSIEVIYTQGTKDKKITKSDEVKFFKGVEYKLIANRDASLFKLIDKMSADEYSRNRRYVARVGGNGIYYTNIKTKERIHNFDVNRIGESISIKESLISNWQLSNEKKKIGEYNCLKATYIKTTKIKGIEETVSTEYTVWYAPELSFSFGPFNLSGLPGLILAIEYDNNYFVASNIKTHNEKLKISRPKSKEMSFDEYYEYIQKKTGWNIKKELEKRKKKKTN